MLRRSESGYVLVTALLALAVMAILGAAAIAQANSALKLAREATESEQALYVANAGAETVLAMVQSREMPEQDPPFHYSGTISIGSGITGSYEVLVTVPRDDLFQIQATGRVGDHLRSIEAEIPAVIDSIPPGPGGSPVLVFGHGPLAFNNKADVCGDLYAVGDITLGSNITVWNRTAAQDPDSPCQSLNGTGRVVATGTLSVGANTEIQGGWCDQARPCNPMPEVETLPAPDFASLKTTATEWYLQPDDSAFCLDKPMGSCTTLDPKDQALSLYGERAYSNAVVFVDGDLVVPKQANRELLVAGNVTFAATGKITLAGDVLCAPGSNCSVTFIAGQDLSVENKTTVWSHLQTEGTLTIHNAVTIHGNLVASKMEVGNGLLLYPQSIGAGTPGGPPVAPSGGSGYLYWRQH